MPILNGSTVTMAELVCEIAVARLLDVERATELARSADAHPIRLDSTAAEEAREGFLLLGCDEDFNDLSRLLGSKEPE